VPDSPGVFELVEDPERSLDLLRQFRAPGGSLRYLAGDWDDGLDPGSFDRIYCRNSLRCSTKRYWRRSLRRFHELLAPGGVLLMETVNAIGIQGEAEALADECGLKAISEEVVRDRVGRFVTWVWPTG
jgi:hypothetical protein